MFEDNPEETSTTENAPEEEHEPSAEASEEAAERPEAVTETEDQEVPGGVTEAAQGGSGRVARPGGESDERGSERILRPEEGTEDAGEATGQPSPVPEGTAEEQDVEDQIVTIPEAEAEEERETTTAEAAATEAPMPAVATVEPSGNGEAVAVPVEAEEEEPSADPYGGPGDWYVIHTYAGYENKVKTNLASRIQTMQMQDKIFDVVIPMEDVMEIKGGRKQVVQKKVFPGYLLVKMIYDDDSWFVVRNTPGVTGFVSSGTGQKPTPLSRREVERILGTKKEEAKPAFRLDFEEGDVVRIISGPFADFNGTIAEINVDQSKVKVMVNIFDRETPVELGFDQVARV